jgi:hypothetical protein
MPQTTVIPDGPVFIPNRPGSVPTGSVSAGKLQDAAPALQ